jgi:DNA-directed RNA polymerase specialized sigma24 family protein
MTAWTQTQVSTTLSRRPVAVPVQRTAGTAADAQADAEELFRRVYPKLAGWVRRLVDDDDTAHEIASEAFVRLLSRPTRVDSPRQYLYVIAANLTKDHGRKTRRERRAVSGVTSVAADEPVI